MSKVSYKKLMGSKWTATIPIEREKHFVVTAIKRAPDHNSREICVSLRPVLSKQVRIVPVGELENVALWNPGWR